MDIENEFLELSKYRKEEISNPKIFQLYQSKIRGFNTKEQLQLTLAEEPKAEYMQELRF